MKSRCCIQATLILQMISWLCKWVAEILPGPYLFSWVVAELPVGDFWALKKNMYLKIKGCLNKLRQGQCNHFYLLGEGRLRNVSLCRQNFRLVSNYLWSKVRTFPADPQLCLSPICSTFTCCCSHSSWERCKKPQLYSNTICDMLHLFLSLIYI